MKKIFILILFTVSFVANGQKNPNGKIFDEHPGIVLVEKFNKAFVDADEAVLNELLADDFKAYNGEWMNKDQNFSTKQNIIWQSKYWKSSLMNYSINKRGGVIS